jgi:hypothetical protein
MSDPIVRQELDYLGFLFSRSTQGVWTPSRGCLLSTAHGSRPIDPRDLEYYGGNLLAESIQCQGDAKWIAEVHNEFPRIVAALQTKLVIG